MKEVTYIIFRNNSTETTVVFSTKFFVNRQEIFVNFQTYNNYSITTVQLHYGNTVSFLKFCDLGWKATDDRGNEYARAREAKETGTVVIQ